MRALHVLNLLLLAGLIGGSMLAWPGLPASYPVHFDLRGQPDGWAEKSVGTWFLLPLVSLLLGALFYGLARFIPRRPQLINIPAKRAFLALSPKAQAPVIAIIVALLYACYAAMLAMFCGIQYGIYAAARGDHRPVVLMATIILSLVVIPTMAIVAMVKTSRAIKRAASEEPIGFR